MRQKSLHLRALSIFLLCCSGATAAYAEPSSACVLPSNLHEEITEKYPHMRVVTMADLDEHDQKLFRKDQGRHCPGLTKVDFYGDRSATWAIVLISGESPNRKAQLLVARQTENAWETRLLDSTNGTPVVWSESAGKYEGMSEPYTILAKNPVIVFCGLESWGVVFAWNGKEVEKLQIWD